MHGVRHLGRGADQRIAVAAGQVGFGDITQGDVLIILLIHLEQASGARHVEVLDRYIEVKPGQVEVEVHRHLSQGRFERNPGADGGVAFARLGLTVGHQRLAGPHDRNGVGIAPQAFRPAGNVLTEGAHLLDPARGAEDALGVPGGKGPPPVRLTGLKQKRPPTNRRHDRERPPGLVPLSLKVDPMDLGRVGKDLAVHVHLYGIRLPAVPQAVARLHVFVGALIAVVVRRQAVQPEVVRLGRRGRRHDIPANPPLGQMIERRQGPGQQKRRVECRGHGDSKAEFSDHRREIGHQCDRVVAGELDRIAHLLGLGAAGQAVGEKQHVELAALQGADHGFPVLALVPLVADLLARIDPRQRHMRRRGKERKASEVDLLGHGRFLM